MSVGTWGHSGPRRVRRHPVGWSGGDDDAAREALIRAWEFGLTHWDTADAYGNGHSERLIGGLWSHLPRKDIFLATKVGWEKGQAEHGYDREQMRRQIDGSFERLGTDTIDLFYLHHCDFGPDDRYLELAVELLRDYRQAGKIHWIGLSDWDSSRVAAYAPRVEPDVVQVYRSVLHDTFQESGLADWVAGADAGACFFSPLQHGLLLGKHDSPPDWDKGDHRSRRAEFQDAALLAHLQQCRAELIAHFGTRRQPLLDALIASALAEAPSACALLGLRRPEHAVAAAEIVTDLSADEIGWVRRLYRGGSAPGNH